MKLTATLEKRLKAIDDAINDIEMTIQDDAPFMVVHPYNILIDEYNIDIYPNGRSTSKSDVLKIEKVPFNALLKTISTADDKTTICFNNTHCLEWMHLYHQNSELLTQEQKERAKEKDVNGFPFLSKLYDGEAGRVLREVISDLPEKGTFKRSFIEELQKGTIEL